MATGVGIEPYTLSVTTIYADPLHYPAIDDYMVDTVGVEPNLQSLIRR